ncbi:4a-hydroxytetrahydrobiopterin dehydratase [Nocardioides sp. R1-1]|uniref:4a-hydroxytetrahydrobiopterin dehydratase n=1 Tax=Nocardioides sp. R1-1 TaxID=3383502 RepID=UPI0038CF31F4
MGYEEISAEQFSQAEGVADWRVLGVHAYAVFRTGSFATGLQLVNAIGELAEEANHHPDLKLGYPSLAVHLTTHDTGTLTTADLDLAQRISAAARNLGVAGDPDAVQAWV